ncbi:beta-N-acetylhexosaminidase [Chitinophaga lutea]|uniref:beta-N-acetylhexosaminidase n=2 Tax=Chitinophaga lutea TaxID=2488634 RepID=A0A3N4QS09_9BACT|nr:beta-N-acetylhexosaminidase [Chitinophaga lutea]
MRSLLLMLLPFTAAAQPALIPQPQEVVWGKGSCLPTGYKALLPMDAAFEKEGKKLLALFPHAGVQQVSRGGYLAIRRGPTKPEGYTLSVHRDSIVITAADAAGAFYGIQTLQQLMDGRKDIPACRITDWPAFPWRGYMVDVGRNYQSMSLLKQQIDVMARYKLNIFHFHPTEDVAWRLAIRQYPQLTAPEHMLRQHGKFYSEAEVQALIAYCRERHITFVPEIDMPGHSAAFKRAMKTDMQSDSGLAIVKNILREVVATYDLPYVHIGGDEVHITNPQFLPAVTELLHSLGKKTIGWSPGGNLHQQTIRQLWMRDGAVEKNLQYIDSRHMYLNHIDPLETPVTLFLRKIDAGTLGATLCLWHDRKIAHESDLLQMNAVYPGIPAFAERTWRGGGHNGMLAAIGAPGAVQTKEFSEFESRLMQHRGTYFAGKPFPYAAQSSIVWNLYGPFDNGGQLEKEFTVNTNAAPVLQIVGGTIVLRHWWAPLVTGVLPDPKENTTWYAVTKIWRDKAGTEDFWVGFNNFSRSPATDSPPANEWDEKKSAVWVNGIAVPPPHWKKAGQKGNSEIPLQDEGYESRVPTKVDLQKGWNIIKVKAPVGSFEGRDWQNPVKWMFTFIPAP